jgi:aspartate carbamoyltransferase catalytic subunit
VSSHTFLQDLDEHFHLISPGVPVMHPGPVVWQGRPHEALLRGPQSLLGDQVRQGVRVRERLWSWVAL